MAAACCAECCVLLLAAVCFVVLLLLPADDAPQKANIEALGASKTALFVPAICLSPLVRSPPPGGNSEAT